MLARVLMVFSIVVVPFAVAFAADEPSPEITDEEFTTLVADIDEAQDTLIGLITGMSDEQWNFRSAPDRWSVAECVEHIVRTEQAVLAGIQAAAAGPPNPEWYAQTNGKNMLVRQAVLTRNPRGAGSPFKAPYEVSPTEHWDRAHAIREFYKAHGALRAFVETAPRAIKNRTFPNPFPEIGMMNAHDWLTLAALHVRRHSMQIEEVQADPKYPRGTAAE